MAATFNTSGLYGLTALSFVNSGMAGKLASTGNAVQVFVGVPKTAELEFASPGGNWTASRLLALRPRRVEWRCQIKATSDSNLNAVEGYITAYIADGRSFALADGFGRTTSWARLVADGTGPVGPRLKHLGAAYSQRWIIVFDVLRPLVGAAVL